MRRRVYKILAFALAVTLATIGIFSLTGFGLIQQYRATTNVELANLLGVISDQYPDVDVAELLQAFDRSDPDSLARGAKVLRSYGYTDTDFALPSARNYTITTFGVSLVIVFGVISVFIVYLWFSERRHRRQINDLVQYVQKLNDRVYDLRIETNAEDELSLLANELYKITVTLKETAEYDRRVRRQLETAMADISHQLKTPLTSLQVTLDNLASEPDMPLTMRQDFLRSSNRQVVEMTNLITTLLNLAKFDNNTIHLQRRLMPVREVLDLVCAKLEILADLQDVRLQVSGDLSAKARLDPRWQAEALSNIVKNCIEHSSAGSTVILSVSDSVLYTRIKISDTGTGITPKDIHHIFERFYKTETSNSSSVGIGLAFAKSVIEADHGQISVKSTLGSGTTFTITYFH